MSDHSIRITLHSLPFEGQERKYYGRLNNAGTLDIRKLAQRMAQSRSDLRAETIANVMHMAMEEIADALAEGRCIDLDIGSLRPTISGTFSSPYQKFDPEQHSIGLKFIPSDDMSARLRKAKVITCADTSTTYIDSIYDVSSRTTNTVITSQHSVVITGSRLRIIGSDTAVGLYFVHSNGQEYGLAERFTVHKPGQLIFCAPEMPEGTCQVRIVTQGGSRGRLTTQLTDYTSDIKLSVRIVSN